MLMASNVMDGGRRPGHWEAGIANVMAAVVFVPHAARPPLCGGVSCGHIGAPASALRRREELGAVFTGRDERERPRLHGPHPPPPTRPADHRFAEDGKQAAGRAALPGGGTPHQLCCIPALRRLSCGLALPGGGSDGLTTPRRVPQASLPLSTAAPTAKRGASVARRAATRASSDGPPAAQGSRAGPPAAPQICSLVTPTSPPRRRSAAASGGPLPPYRDRVGTRKEWEMGSSAVRFG